MNAPLAVRCPACFYLPPGAQVICSNCGNDKREAIPPLPKCPYQRGTFCGCGLRGVCLEAA